MTETVIDIRHVSKKYRINQDPYFTLRDSISNFFSRVHRGDDSPAKEFWALKDINLRISKGEIVGIIGNNGAGKSTLLKIISGITPPTEGEVRLRGSVTSMLEVGTGFNPELTGRENIYLNGAILGMSRREITKKFDTIVQFAGTKKFLDTPVKYYSTGMYTRLAFSVSVHLDSEILIVDEVLSVGDIEFQKKCFEKMEYIGKQGKTILLVSHSMQAVSNLCERIILLKEGTLVEDGPAQEVIGKYTGTSSIAAAHVQWDSTGDAPGNESVRLVEVSVKNHKGLVAKTHDIDKKISIEIVYAALEDGLFLVPSLQILNEQGVGVFSSNDTELEWNTTPRKKKRYTSTVEIPGNLLSDGQYFVRVVIATFVPYQKHVNIFDVVGFSVTDRSGPHTARGNYKGAIPGIVRPRLLWKTIEKLR